MAAVRFFPCWADTSLLARRVIHPPLEKQCARLSQQHSPHYLHVAVRQVWPLSPAWGCLFTAKNKNTEEARMIHLWEVRYVLHVLRLRCQLANFNGWLHLRHFEKTIFKRQSTFPEKNQFPDKGFMLSISQERATLRGLGEEICQKYLFFFYLKVSAFITFLVF